MARATRCGFGGWLVSAVNATMQWSRWATTLLDPGRLRRVVANWLGQGILELLTLPTPVGLGGGGNLLKPSVSPTDPDLIFVPLDLGALFLSTDGGYSWNAIDGADMLGSQCPITFQSDGRTVWAFHTYRGLRSTDAKGSLTWSATVPNQPTWSGYLTVSAMLATANYLLVGIGLTEGNSPDALSDAVPRAAYRVTLSPPSWESTMALPPGEDVIRFAQVGSQFLMATSKNIYSSTDGKSWSPTSVAGLETELARGRIKDFTAGPAANGAVMYLTVGAFDLGGARTVYRWNGSMWTSVAVTDTRLGISAAQPAYVQLGSDGRVYVTSGTDFPEVYVSYDGGNTWALVFLAPNDSRNPSDPNIRGASVVDSGWLENEPPGKGFAGAPRGLALAASDPNRVVIVNRSGPYVRTALNGWVAVFFALNKLPTDWWNQRYCFFQGTMPDFPPSTNTKTLWTSTGLDVTTTWQYAVDPLNPHRHYICATDIGFAQSEDDGISWRYVGDPNDFLNFNQIIFDPATNRQWAATSQQHDIPHERQLGGIDVNVPAGHVLTRASGDAPWSIATNGLPTVGPVVSVELDSSTGRLYASLWGVGIFQGIPNAQGSITWAALSPQISSPSLNVYRLQFVDGKLRGGAEDDQRRSACPNLGRARHEAILNKASAHVNSTVRAPSLADGDFRASPASDYVRYLRASASTYSRSS